MIELIAGIAILCIAIYIMEGIYTTIIDKKIQNYIDQLNAATLEHDKVIKQATSIIISQQAEINDANQELRLYHEIYSPTEQQIPINTIVRITGGPHINMLGVVKQQIRGLLIVKLHDQETEIVHITDVTAV